MMNNHNRFEPPQPFNQQPHGPVPQSQTVSSPGPVPPPGPVPQPEEPKKTNWFMRHKILTTIGAIIAIAIIGSSLGGSSDPDPADAATNSPTSAEPAQSAESDDGTTPEDEATPAGEETTQPAEENSEPEETASEKEPEEPAASAFEAFTTTGSGDSVIPLPEGAIEGIITATHQGSANFVINALDANNEMSGDLAVNTIGSYSGTTAFGVTAFTDATAFQVTANGPWEITIAPFSDAPVAEFPLAGDSDSVYRYDGAASVIEFSHQGSANFIVMQTDDLFPSLHINEIGAYTGSVPMKAGPNYLIIQADGGWTAQ